MWLINTALRRPIMVIVLVVGIALCSILAYQRMSIDIFPNLDLPVIYVAQPYGGMNPAQTVCRKPVSCGCSESRTVSARSSMAAMRPPR